jgi:thiol-disulfide isomerase/thioredoxin
MSKILRKLMLTALCIGCLATISQAQTDAIVVGQVDSAVARSVRIEFKRNHFLLEDGSFEAVLDANNTFSFRVKLTESRAVVFTHRNESVRLFLTPGDTLKMHFKSKHLLETMVYDGSAALHNDYLLKSETQLSEVNATQNALASVKNATARNHLAFIDNAYNEKKRFFDSYPTDLKSNFSNDFLDFALNDNTYWRAFYLMEYVRENGLTNPNFDKQVDDSFFSFLFETDNAYYKALNNQNYVQYLELYLGYLREKSGRGKQTDGDTLEIHTTSVQKARSKGANIRVLEEPYLKNDVVSWLSVGEEAEYQNLSTSEKFKYVLPDTTIEDIFLRVRTPEGRFGWVPQSMVNLYDRTKFDTIHRRRFCYQPEKEFCGFEDNLTGKVLYFTMTKDILMGFMYDDEASMRRRMNEFISRNSSYEEYNVVLRTALQRTLLERSRGEKNKVFIPASCELERYEKDRGFYTVELNRLPLAKRTLNSNTSLLSFASNRADEDRAKLANENRLKAEKEAKDRLAEENRLIAEKQVKAKLVNEENRLKAEKEANAKLIEENRLKAEQEAKATLAEQVRIKAEQEAKDKLANEIRIKAEQESKAKLAEQVKVKAEQEAKDKLANEIRIKAEQEAKAKLAEQVRVKAEQEAKDKLANEIRIKAEQEAKATLAEQVRIKAEQEAKDKLANEIRIKAEQEAKATLAEKVRIKAEQEAKDKLANEIRIKAEQEAKAKLAEQVRVKAEQEAKDKLANEVRIKAEQEAKAKLAEQVKVKAEQEAKDKLANEVRIKAEQEAKAKLAEQVKVKAEQEAKDKLANEVRIKAEQEAKAKLAEQVRVKAEQEAKDKLANEVRIKAEQEAKAKLAEQVRVKAEQEAKDKLEEIRLKAEKANDKLAEEIRLKAAKDAKDKAEEVRIKAEKEAKLAQEVTTKKLLENNAQQGTTTPNKPVFQQNHIVNAPGVKDPNEIVNDPNDKNPKNPNDIVSEANGIKMVRQADGNFVAVSIPTKVKEPEKSAPSDYVVKTTDPTSKAVRFVAPKGVDLDTTQEIIPLMDKLEFDPTGQFVEFKGLVLNEEMPRFVLTDINGKLVTQEEIKNKVVFIDFWASWCGPCVAQFSHAKILMEKYKNDDVMFLYISIDTDIETWKEHLKYNPMAGVHGNDKLILPINFQVTGIPNSFIIAKSGKVAFNSRLKSKINDDRMIQLLLNSK